MHYSVMTAESIDEVAPLEEAQIVQESFLFPDTLFPWIIGLIWLCLILLPAANILPWRDIRQRAL